MDLRSAYAGWSIGDFEAFVEVLDPDVEFRLSGVFPDLAPSYHGHDGMREFWHSFTEPWEELTVVPENVVERGDRAVVLLVFQGLGRDGIEVERRFAHLLTLRGDRIARIQGFADPEQALAALDAP